MDFSSLLVFKMPYAAVFWAVLAWAYTMEAIQHKRRADRSGSASGDDRYSGLVISLGAGGLQVAAFFVGAVTAWQVSPELSLPWFYTGVALVVAGMLLRMVCWRVLGNFFTHTVTIASDHRVVDQGPYRFVRHPSYLGALMTLAGLGFALHNWAALAMMVIGSFAIYVYRIEVEERALERALGDAYAQFKKSRARLIPFVY
jgi:protein-S-isoprenylcysteine O-methyltransferase Ste14